MKIIIEHGKTKREINGSFNICGNAEDLRSLRDQVSAQIDREDVGFSHGWVKIHANIQKTVGDTPPIPWD